MKIDGAVLTPDPREVPQAARELEELGYDGILTAETAHDPFLPLVLAARAHRAHRARHRHRGRVRPQPDDHSRTPANDLQPHSKGRFILGLGSQIKPHIEKRFSMPWSHPAPRMREFILAMRAIWAYWNDGEKLDFRGEFYRHTLMTPFFNPGPNPHGPPKVFLAAVGEHMTEVAGEVADGIIIHGFTTERYVREVTLPALERGLARRPARRAPTSRSRGPLFVVTGTNEEEMAKARAGHAAADRVLRLDARVPRCARAPRLGRRCRPSSTDCRSRASGCRWASSSTTTSSTRSRWSASPRSCPELLQERYGDVVDRLSVLRAVQERSRPLVGCGGAAQGELNRRIDATIVAGILHRPEVAEPGRDLEAPRPEAGRRPSARGRA